MLSKDSCTIHPAICHYNYIFFKFLPEPKISEITQEENDIILDPVPGVVFTMLNSVRVGPKKV